MGGVSLGLLVCLVDSNIVPVLARMYFQKHVSHFDICLGDMPSEFLYIFVFCTQLYQEPISHFCDSESIGSILDRTGDRK